MGKPDPNGTERLSTGVLAGLTHHRAGRLVEAAQAYQQALRESGTDADALLLLGLLARLTGRRQAAIRLTALAVELRPKSAGFHLSLAQAYLADGNGVAAAESCRKALELNPRLAAGWCCLGEAEAVRGAYEAAQWAWKAAAGLDSRSTRPERSVGNLLARLGRFDEAAAAYRAGLRKAPGDATLHYALGAALAASAHRREAKAAYREALRLRPNFPEALLNLGNVHYDEGAYAAAAVCCRKALALRPTYAKAWCNLGNALQMMGGAREATGCYERTLALDPTTVAARHNLGNAWMARRDYAQAEACFRETLAMDAERSEHYNSLGNALFQQRRNDEAEACYRMALEVDRDYAAVHTNLANVLMRQSSRAEMIRHYERALELDPKSAGGHYNLALAYLRQGRYAEGWPAHEWRWDFRELRLRRRHFAAPQWRGEKLNGETILLHAEQGLGDTLQFVRYAPLVAERGGRVVLEVQPRLVRLLQGLPSVSRVVGRGEPLGDFAWHCPLMSLPLAFGSTVDTIPRRVPYVRADEEEVRAARQRWTGTGLRVGIAWAGNPQYRSDEQRSMPLLALLPLAGVPGITWLSLQMGTACGQMRTVGERFPLIDASSTSRDLAETAALVATLDLVITVDTAMAHLAGAMGVPLWVVLPHLADWRWMEERADSPWYPGARLFRQPAPGDWASAVERMRGELERWISGRIGDEGDGAVWGGTAGDADATVPWT